MNKLLILIVGVLFLSSCGSKVTVYSWNELEILNFNRSTQQNNLDSQSIKLEDFMLRVNLNASVVDIYASSGGFKTSKKDILAQQKLDSIQIFSLDGFDDTLRQDSILLNQFFRAAYPSDSPVLDSIQNFVDDFGQSNDSLESHFDLYLQQKPELPVQQFIINAYLNDGRILIDTTQKVRFVD